MHETREVDHQDRKKHEGRRIPPPPEGPSSSFPNGIVATLQEQMYQYLLIISGEEWISSVLSSTPLVLSRELINQVSDRLSSATQLVLSRELVDRVGLSSAATLSSWTMMLSSDNCSYSLVPVDLVPFLDANQDGKICLAEVLERWFLWRTRYAQALWSYTILPTVFGDLQQQQENQEEEYYGPWLVRMMGLGMVVLAVLTVVPGRYGHTYSARILRWPVLGYTYALIMVEFILYCLVRLVIYVAEAVIPQSHAEIRRAMKQASSYEEWYMHAQYLNEVAEPYRMAWLEKSDDESTTSHAYNWKFIRLLIQDLKVSRHEQDIFMALTLLQQCTRQNVGGIMSPALFSYSYTGEPKRIVTEFMKEVVLTLQWIAEQATATTTKTMNAVAETSEQQEDAPKLESKQEEKEDEEAVKIIRKGVTSLMHSFIDRRGGQQKGIASSGGGEREISTTNSKDSTTQAVAADVASSSSKTPQQQRPRPNEAQVYRLQQVLALLKRSRASYGHTALCLSGGASMGTMHIGVIRGLIRHGTLPNIISGTSAGSLGAALVCTRTNEELEQTLAPESLAAHSDICERPWTERLQSVYETGCLFSGEDWMAKFQWFANGPDMTFEEAFQRTGRVLCITVSSTSKKAPPVLLSHISAPNVTIVSALLASAAVPGCIPAVRLQYKDASTGEIRPYIDADQTFFDGSIQQDIPTKGLGGMFNCQFFITSQVNPHINPFFFNQKGAIGRPTQWSSGEEHSWRGGFLLAALEMYLKYEMKAKFQFLHEVEAAIGFTSSMMAQEFKGSITMIPEIAFADFSQILADPDLPTIKRRMQSGELVAYQHISFIKHHYAIPDALDACIFQLEQCVAAGTDGDPYSSFVAAAPATTKAVAAACIAVASTVMNKKDDDNNKTPTTVTRTENNNLTSLRALRRSLFVGVHSLSGTVLADNNNINPDKDQTTIAKQQGLRTSNYGSSGAQFTATRQSVPFVGGGGRGKHRTSGCAGFEFGVLDLFEDDDDDFEPIIYNVTDEGQQ